jgi:hypothetical protein
MNHHYPFRLARRSILNTEKSMCRLRPGPRSSIMADRAPMSQASSATFLKLLAHSLPPLERTPYHLRHRHPVADPAWAACGGAAARRHDGIHVTLLLGAFSHESFQRVFDLIKSRVDSLAKKRAAVSVTAPRPLAIERGRPNVALIKFIQHVGHRSVFRGGGKGSGRLGIAGLNSSGGPGACVPHRIIVPTAPLDSARRTQKSKEKTAAARRPRRREMSPWSKETAPAALRQLRPPYGSCRPHRTKVTDGTKPITMNIANRSGAMYQRGNHD